MSESRFQHRHLDVACELEAADAGTRAEEWRRLREEAGLGSDPIAGGTRLWLRPDARSAAEDLARREAGCCGFLDLAIARDGDRLRLDITSLAPDAAPVIAVITGRGAGD
ncbi:MAG TPA: hypothetical protein VG205_06325 [Acidimicrobiales bacterium]|jgi:hypothetical protein|nr:hypothetical protein [Acidimicrobiales bacterium]